MTNASTGAAPVEKWTPERRRARTRTALVDAARFVFARKGFEGASLDEIADTAGYTRGAIYKHFDGKEELLFAVFDQVNNQALERFSELMELDPAGAIEPSTIVDTWKALFARRRRRAHARSRVPALRAATPGGARAGRRPPGAQPPTHRSSSCAPIRADGNLEFKVAPETLAADPVDHRRRLQLPGADRSGRRPAVPGVPGAVPAHGHLGELTPAGDWLAAVAPLPRGPGRCRQPWSCVLRAGASAIG